MYVLQRLLIPCSSVVVFIALSCLITGCQDDERPRAAVPVPRELESRWDLFPHRFSLLELTFEPAEEGGTVHGLTAGGGWGVMDTPWVRYGWSIWRSRALAWETAQVEIEISPDSEDAGEPHAVTREVTIPAGRLAGAGAVVALVRGFSLSTDEYENPPPFESDPDLPYDPIEGYTSLGMGISLGEPTLRGDELVVDVRVRNSLGLSDRADMNAAIPEATSWVRVDLLLVGAFGQGATATSGEVQYDISAADYGQNTVHDHASEEEQQVTIEGVRGPSSALFGLKAFDFWLNMDGRHDPDCEVVQDEINSWEEEVSGPGRYVRVMSARLHGESYDSATGRGAAMADLMFSNSSTFKEVGNLCLRARAEVAMLQFDDPDAWLERPEPLDERLEPGDSESWDVRWNGER